MPTYKEIYHSHNEMYDALVRHEDYQNNLGNYLLENFDFSGSVLEPGAGTGRLTKIYGQLSEKIVLCDVSAHMLEKAETNLISLKDKISFCELSHEDFSAGNVPFDTNEFSIIIEGWSLCHFVNDHKNNIENILDDFISRSFDYLKDEGWMILIETFGTNVEKEAVSADHLIRMYDLLENKYNFEKKVLRTDYLFESLDDAKRIMTFFFGDDMKIGSEKVREFTGVWFKQRKD